MSSTHVFYRQSCSSTSIYQLLYLNYNTLYIFLT
nr:hypothetical protein CACDSRKY_CACDSRKY_CDS_0057 [Caudoviricetes sp.]